MKGVFGDCQFTCFPDCQLALPPESAKNQKFALLAAAAFVASPAAFAAEQDLCEINMQEIDDNMATSMTTLGEPARSQIEEHVKQARDAKQAGNTEDCIVHSTKALQELKGPGSSTPGSAGSSSGAGN